MAENNVTEARATAKYVRIAPRKARLVVDQIRNKSVDRAQELLAFNQRAAAVPVAKVLNSAVANAENNHGMRGADLVIKSAYVEAYVPHHYRRRTSKGGVSNHGSEGTSYWISPGNH